MCAEMTPQAIETAHAICVRESRLAAATYLRGAGVCLDHARAVLSGLTDGADAARAAGRGAASPKPALKAREVALPAPEVLVHAAPAKVVLGSTTPAVHFQAPVFGATMCAASLVLAPESPVPFVLRFSKRTLAAAAPQPEAPLAPVAALIEDEEILERAPRTPSEEDYEVPAISWPTWPVSSPLNFVEDEEYLAQAPRTPSEEIYEIESPAPVAVEELVPVCLVQIEEEPEECARAPRTPDEEHMEVSVVHAAMAPNAAEPEITEIQEIVEVPVALAVLGMDPQPPEDAPVAEVVSAEESWAPEAELEQPEHLDGEEAVELVDDIPAMFRFFGIPADEVAAPEQIQVDVVASLVASHANEEIPVLTEEVCGPPVPSADVEHELPAVLEADTGNLVGEELSSALVVAPERAERGIGAADVVFEGGTPAYSNALDRFVETGVLAAAWDGQDYLATEVESPIDQGGLDPLFGMVGAGAGTMAALHWVAPAKPARTGMLEAFRGALRLGGPVSANRWGSRT